MRRQRQRTVPPNESRMILSALITNLGKGDAVTSNIGVTCSEPSKLMHIPEQTWTPSAWLLDSHHG